MKKGPVIHSTDPLNCAQIVPVRVKLLQINPNETKNVKKNLCIINRLESHNNRGFFIDGLKIPRPQGHVGSSPTSGTKLYPRTSGTIHQALRNKGFFYCLTDSRAIISFNPSIT
jgi:hypothetical protein